MPEILEVLKKVKNEEERILENFEERLSLFYKHRKLSENLSRKIKNSVDRKKLIESKESLRGLIEEIISYLHTSSFENKLLDELESIREVKDKIRQSLDRNEVQKNLKLLSEEFGEMENEEEALKELIKRIKGFERILEIEEGKLNEELQIIQDIDNPEADLGLIRHKLRGDRLELKRVLKDEKKRMHDPLEKFIKHTKRLEKRIKKLEERKNITLDDIKRDVYGFTTPEEFTEYKRKLNKSSLELGDKEKRFLDRMELINIQAQKKDRKKLSKLKKWINKDKLTGLANRKNFEEKIKEFEENVNRGNLQDFSLLLFDIDSFKQINDTFGHQKGDKALKKISSVIKKLKRKTDLAFRWGGEEIAVLMPGEVNVKVAGERFRKKIEEETTELMKEFNKITSTSRKSITVSIGAAKLSETGTVNNLLKLADERMYFAKNHGKNQVVFD